MCREVEYIPPQAAQAHTVSQLSSDWIMHWWFHSVAVEIAVSTKKKKKKSEGNAVFIISALMPAVSERGSCVSLYTSSGRLSNLL